MATSSGWTSSSRSAPTGGELRRVIAELLSGEEQRWLVLCGVFCILCSVFCILYFVSCILDYFYIYVLSGEEQRWLVLCGVFCILCSVICILYFVSCILDYFYIYVLSGEEQVWLVFCILFFFTSIYYLVGDRDGWNHVQYVLCTVYHQVYLLLVWYGEEERWRESVGRGRGLGSGGEMIEQQAVLEQANPRRPRFHPIGWPALSLYFTQLGQRGEKRGWGGNE